MNAGIPFDNKAQYARTYSVKIYKGTEYQNPQNILLRNNVVSGVIERTGKMFLCLEPSKDKGTIALHPVMFNHDDEGFWCYDLWYSKAEAGSCVDVCQSRQELLGMASDYFLFLQPMETETQPNTHQHTVICRSWRVRHQGDELALPVPHTDTSNVTPTITLLLLTLVRTHVYLFALSLQQVHFLCTLKPPSQLMQHRFHPYPSFSLTFLTHP